MKDRIVVVFNAMHRIETKGESTLILADCLRELAQIINSMESEETNEQQDV